MKRHGEGIRRSSLATLAICVVGVSSCGGLRATNPYRTADGSNARIPIERVGDKTDVEWRIVSLGEVMETLEEKTLSEAKAKVLNGDWGDFNPVGRGSAGSGDPDPEAGLHHGDYGQAYLLQVMESDGGSLVRNTVRVVDDRPADLALGSHLGLLFVPELDAALTSAQVSLYPARLAAIDRYGKPNISWLTDGFSFDAGIVGGSVIGDAPPELDGRTAFTFGAGLQFIKGWAFKTGVVAYRNAVDDDDLDTSWYLGISYDLLSGLKVSD